MITITSPDDQLLADQRGQYLYTPQGVFTPTGPARWDFAAMAALWDAMCAATGDHYILRVSPA